VGVGQKSAALPRSNAGRTQQAPVLGRASRMYARIISSSGLDSEHASMTAEKSREGAIIWCRVNHDYSTECIRHWLEDNTQFAPTKTTTLHANCRTKKYTDFIGRNLQDLDDDILNLDTNDKISNSAGGTAVATSAFEALCPKAERQAINKLSDAVYPPRVMPDWGVAPIEWAPQTVRAMLWEDKQVR
jgi:hypothetical protein